MQRVTAGRKTKTRTSPGIIAAGTQFRRHVIVFLALLGASVLAGRAMAQTLGSQASAPGSKYYVWGQVGAPGAYSFVANPDLLELLSAAGGPTQNANLKRVVLIRMVTQTRTRINLQSMLNRGQVVRLSPGDVVVVPSSAWYSIREALTYVTFFVSAATLAFTTWNWVGGT